MSESNFDLTPTMPQVWYLDRAYEWHFLAPNFTTYFRMMIYHLGLPQWQLLFTPNGPTPWAKVRIPIFSICILKPRYSEQVFQILFVHCIE